MPNRQIKLIAALSLLLLVLVSASAVYSQPAPEIGLTILHTNDLHGMLFPFDYNILGTTEKNVGSAARRAALIRKLKAESPKPVLVMDAGDVFVRGPLEKLEGKPDLDVLNAVPYDVMTLGNNDFTGDQYTGSPGPKGVKILRERLKQAKFPVVCANVIDKATGKPLVPPYVIIEQGGIKIGIFGLTTPRYANYPQTKDLEITDPIAAAKKIIPELQPKCDVIIALTHIGYPWDVVLAREVPSIAAVIGGDTHTWVPEPMAFKPANPDGPAWWVGAPVVCQDGEWGKCLGRLDLAFRKDSSGHWRVVRYAGKLIPITSSDPSAPDVDKILSPYAP